MSNKILEGTSSSLARIVSARLDVIAMRGLDAYNPPSDIIPASCVLWASELCNRHKKGTGRPRMMKSVTAFSTPRAMSAASRFSHRGLAA